MQTMKTELELNEMILGLTNIIRDKYPDLLKFLNEKPVTIPYEEHPTITVEALTSYYDALVGLVSRYLSIGLKDLKLDSALNLRIPEIQTMEHENSYQDLLTEVSNFTISYNDVGEGEIPIIFLHGFPFDKTMWKGQLDNLKSNNRLIAVDIRGFGKSIDANSELSMDLFGQDLIAFMDKLQIDKAVVCGLSMGGYIALNVLKNYPNRFEALILCDTQCIADTAEGKEKRYKTIEQINTDGPSEFNDGFIKNVFHADSLSAKHEIVESLRSTVVANSKEAITAGLVALAERSETCSSLSDIQVPTLIICGKQDVVTPLAQSEFMHSHIKGSTLKVIDNAGHVSNLEQPEEFNKHLVDFLNSLNKL